MTGRAVTLAAAVLLSATGLGVSSPTVDFKNFTYATHPCGPLPMTMRDGHADYDMPDIAQTLSLDLSAVYPGRLGNRDVAVVVLSCGLPVGSDSVAYAYAIDGTNATFLKSLGEVSPGEGGYAPDAWLRVKFSGNVLDVDRLADPEMYPDLWTEATYRFQGDALVAFDARLSSGANAPDWTQLPDPTFPLGVQALAFAGDNLLDVDHVMTLDDWTVGVDPSRTPTATLTTPCAIRVAGTHIPCVLTIDGLTCTNAARARDCTITLEYDTWIDEYDCAVIVAGKSLPLPGCPEVRFNESETPSGTMVHRSDQSRPGSGFCRRIDRRTDGALGDRGAARRFVARGSACKPRRRSNEIERLGRRTLLAASRCATERPPTLRSIGWRTRGECRAGVGS